MRCRVIKYRTKIADNITYSFEGIEKSVFFYGILNVSIDQERVGFGVNVLDGNLEAIEATSLGNLDLAHELAGEILVYDAI